MRDGTHGDHVQFWTSVVAVVSSAPLQVNDQGLRHQGFSMIDQIIGRYHLQKKIGEGGMGVVYGAYDSDLKRQVAIKLLREDLAKDSGFIERFKREAEVLASLNHPGIASIYGIEDCHGTQALVMEMVAGATLSDRIARGAMPISEALHVAREIANALEYAHAHGVIHRDLKPSNIKITPEGSVKLLDFGLAKTVVVCWSLQETDSSTTVTGTGPGVVLGTSAYMSPEQARGDPADKRTDIWAFGIVLFQMLAGRHPFARETPSQTVAAILESEPDWGKLPRNLAFGIHKLLRHCLEKDPKQRLRDIGDANLEMADVLQAPSPPDTKFASSTRAVLLQRVAFWAVVPLVVVSMIAVLVFRLRPAPPGPRTHLSIPLPPGQQLTGPPAISPDGRIVSWTSRTGTGRALLYVRPLNDPEPKAIGGSEDAFLPFFSPDGEWVAFFARGRLLKAAVSGGSVTAIADAPDPWGGTWGKDGSIVFTPAFNSGLVRVSANGGQGETLTKPDGAAGGYGHMYPQFLPDGRHLVFSLWSTDPEHNGTALLSLGNLQWHVVLPAWTEVAYPVPGYLVTGDRGAGLRIAPMNSDHPVAAQVERSIINQPVAFLVQNARSWFAVSQNGTLVYASADVAKSTLVWVDRNGVAEPITDEEQDYWSPALSPDGERVAVRIGPDLWVYDLRRSAGNRLTFSGYNTSPVWTPDGLSIIYASNRGGGDVDLYSQPTGGSLSATRLLKKDSTQIPCSILRDGTVAFVDYAQTGRDLWTLSPDGKATPFLVTPFNKSQCRFSPNGRFLAYSSDESGRREIYVQPFPGPGEKIAISTNGGSNPVWSRDGRELFFRQGDAMMAVDVATTGAAFRAARERQLFATTDLGFREGFDVSADGKRFVMVHREPGSWPTQLDVVLNCLSDLPRAKDAN
jgi:eukaryotic-like serine/threonine-protein kinase